MEIYYQKIYLYNTTIYKKCAQRVNVQYKVLTLYETKPGKKSRPNASLLFYGKIKFHINSKNETKFVIDFYLKFF
jgi:hypothetical protein